MRLRLGRPGLQAHSHRFAVPQANAASALQVTFLGVSTLLFSDGDSTLLTDGFFSRPGLVRVGLGRIAPDARRIDSCLARAGISTLDAVIPVHSHYDHGLDSATVVRRCGGLLVGGESTANLGRGAGLPNAQIAVAEPGVTMSLGSYRVTLIESMHCPPDRFPGVISEPLCPPVRTRAFKCGEAWSVLLEHRSGSRALVQGSAGFVRGSLAGRQAEVAYLGVGQLGVLDEQYLLDYWDETVLTVGAKRVVLTHWDDFFRPLDKPLRALPYAADDLNRTLHLLDELAARDGVEIALPTVWRAEDPWLGL
jgi:L-ascorbate metabolism protein UlaG (beta-lactamase superfamily)